MGRWLIELLLTAIAGLAALAFPVIVGSAIRGHEAAFLPVIRDVVQGVGASSLVLLFGVGAAAGVLGRAPTILLGFASAAALPIWSAIDLAMGGQSHNLLPIEWFVYGVYGLIGTAGAIIGRNRGFKKPSHGEKSVG